jgi:geranylgeranyl reductase family protein
MDKTIAIIGAGPAGSMLAYKIAPHAKKVLLYDHKAPWEKPCGGMLRPDIIEAHTELKEYPYPVCWCNEIQYISPRNHRKLIKTEKAIPVISRLEFNKYLLEIAIKSGAEYLQKKVTGITQDNTRWIIETNSHFEKVDIIVGADGVNSIVRTKTIGKLPDKHLCITVGYLLTGVPENQYIISFIERWGYLWVFSRSDHTSAGIGTELGVVPAGELFRKLDDFLISNYPGFDIKKKYSALVPAARDERFFNFACCAKNWLLVGDAAGHVDPLFGEGIYYALESAKVAAQAILRGHIQLYDKLWKDRYGNILKHRALFRRNLSIFAQNFNPEIIGLVMYSQATESRFSDEISLKPDARPLDSINHDTEKQVSQPR